MGGCTLESKMTEYIQIGIGLASLIGTLLVWWLSVNLRNTQLQMQIAEEKNKAELLAHQQVVKDDLGEKHDELVANQTALKTDFDQKHAENRQSLAVHIAEDRGSFATIAQAQTATAATLARIEGKLNGLNGH
jgi:uncharacterized protein involved in exopolysaccharide biosynthesis